MEMLATGRIPGNGNFPDYVMQHSSVWDPIDMGIPGGPTRAYNIPGCAS